MAIYPMEISGHGHALVSAYSRGGHDDALLTRRVTTARLLGHISATSIHRMVAEAALFPDGRNTS